jgi:hypothetical protein
MTFAELIVKFGTVGAEKIEADIKKIGKTMEETGAKANSMVSSIMSIATGTIVGDVITGMAKGLFELGKSFFQAGMEAQTTNARFAAFGLDVVKTNNMLYSVAETSTLTTKQLKEMTLQLHQAGFNVNAAVPRLAKWADAIGGGTEQLRGMVRLLNLLRSGVKPDQELLQSLGFSDILIKAGLKFDEGKLVGGIRPAIQAVMNEIDRMTSGLTEKVAGTFEARLATLTDFFDRLKEQIGMQLISFAGPLIDALNKTLGAVIKSNVIADALKEFFSIGKGMMDNLSKGIDNKKVQNMIADVVSTILSHFAVFPQVMKNTGQVIGKVFTFLVDNINVATIAVQKFNALLSGDFEELQRLNDLDIKKPVLDIETQLLNYDIIGFRQQMLQQSMKSKMMTGFGKGGTFTPETEMLLKNATLGSGRDESSGKGSKDKEAKKVGEKQLKTLELIENHTRQTSEFSLRNMTYGGGMLAAQGISNVEMRGYNRVSSPQISASNDIVRGVEKLYKGFQVSNSLNINPRRA